MDNDEKIKLAHIYAERVRSDFHHKRFIEFELEEARRTLEVRGVQYGDKVSTSPTDAAIPEGVAKVIELEGKLDQFLVGYIENRSELIDVLSRIESPYYDALFGHYLLNMKWEELCVEMHYSYRMIMYFRHKGLLKLYEVMPLEYRDAERIE